MNEIKTEKGVLGFRFPNILEVYKVLDLSLVLDEKTTTFDVRGHVIERLEPFLDLSKLEGVSSYNELINDPDTFFHATQEISDLIFRKMMELLGKKNSSLMP